MGLSRHWHCWQLMAHTVPVGMWGVWLGRGQCRRCSVCWSRAGTASSGRGAGLPSVSLWESHAGPAATAPGPLCHRGVCWGLLLHALPALQYSGHGAGDGRSRWGRFWGGSRALGTALAGAGVPGPGCVRVPQPGKAQEGCKSAVGPARALRPRSGGRMSSDGRCPRHRAPSPWGCSRPAW